MHTLSYENSENVETRPTEDLKLLIYAIFIRPTQRQSARSGRRSYEHCIFYNGW